jgi:hypothetical protein
VDEIGYIPKSLEAQERFLWWDFDQAILFLLVMGMGVVSGAMVAGMVFGGLVAWQYGRLKTGQASEVRTACPVLVAAELDRDPSSSDTAIPSIGSFLG